ncbi:CPBP family intramembrane glutamic endopeptidase [Actinomadura flavalba]|uniref:CPBP family intramembrane glutamic endopeptidase n=1 Tax=Actinomadura flavalba TaxID=1120938 RepID=UPI0003A901E4|nr:type II CAAX endopeptidase family protein [Actinomadura flavalba]
MGERPDSPWGGDVGQPQRPGPAPAPYGAPYGAWGPPGAGYQMAYGPPQGRRAWVVEPEPDVPYHRMARTRVHRWWRPLLGTLLIVGVWVVVAAALMIVVFIGLVAVKGVPEESDGDLLEFFGPLGGLVVNLGLLALLIPVVFLAAWAVQRRRPGTLSSVTGRLRWRWTAVCAGVAVVFCAITLGTSLLAAGQVDDPLIEAGWAGWDEFLVPALLILLLVPFQAAAEEYAFRGWLLQAVGACTLENSTNRVGRALSTVFRTPWPAVLVASAFFTAGHGYTGWGILDIFAFGFVAAFLTIRTGGLEAAIALHVLNNLMAFWLMAAAGDLDIEQGAVPWQYVLGDLVALAVFAAVVLLLARRLGVRRVTPEPRAVG